MILISCQGMDVMMKVMKIERDYEMWDDYMKDQQDTLYKRIDKSEDLDKEGK